MRLSNMLALITARTGMAVWRHRIACLVATFAVAALGLYQLTYARPSVAPGDCADTTMSAATGGNDDVDRAAYACMSPSLRTASEDQWVAGMQQQDMPRGQQVTRIGDQRTPDGGRIVFFTVAGQGGAVGYIVYLDPQGMVFKVE